MKENLVAPEKRIPLPVLQASIDGQELLDPMLPHMICMLLGFIPAHGSPFRQQTHLQRTVGLEQEQEEGKKGKKEKK